MGQMPELEPIQQSQNTEENSKAMKTTMDSHLRASLMLPLPPNSWQKRHCSLTAGSLVPVAKQEVCQSTKFRHERSLNMSNI